MRAGARLDGHHMSYCEYFDGISPKAMKPGIRTVIKAMTKVP